MGTVSASTVPTAERVALSLWLNRALETLWLLTVVLVPLAYLGRSYGEWSSVIGSFELPKIVLLRTLAGLMAVLWLVEWGTVGQFPLGLWRKGFTFAVRPKEWLSELHNWLSEKPTRWLVLAIAIFLGTVVLSTLLSASRGMSLWGDIPGQDSYSTYTVFAYILVAAVVATHLKTQSQLWRLLGCIVVVGVLVAGYSVLQYYGHDFLDLLEPPVGKRSSSTLGNPLFAGALILMTIPISLTLAAATMREPIRTAGFWWKQGLWSLVLAVQFMGIIFTLSRGPWFGTILAVAGFLVMAGFLMGWRKLAPTAMMLVFAGALAAVLILSLSRPQDQTATIEAVGSRFTSASSQGGIAGLGNRIEVWKGSGELIAEHPWFEFDNLSLSPIRPLIGYGPELFRSAYLLESPPIGERVLPHEVAHAHNYFVHQGVELGILGLLASVGVFLALFLVGGYQILRYGRSYSTVHQLVLIGLLATIAGKLLEDMAGVARVSDLTIFWVLLAVFLALPTMMLNPKAEQLQAVGRRPRGSPRRPGSRSTQGLRTYPWQRAGQLVLIACAVVGIASVTWLKTIDYARAAVIADGAAAQFREGDPQSSLSSLDRAIDLAPDVSTYYDIRAIPISEIQAQSPSLRAANSSTEPSVQDQVLAISEETYQRNLRWTRNRPYSYRSRLALAASAFHLWTLNGEQALADQSAQLYREAAQMVPNSWQTWHRLAEVHISLKQPEAASEPLERALALVGDGVDSVSTRLLQAQVLIDRGEAQHALDALDGLIDLDPRSAAVYSLRGTIHHGLGQQLRAIEDFGTAIEQNPNFAEYYYNRGTTYFQIGRIQKAIEDLDQAIRLDPQHHNAYNSRGLASVEAGRLQIALEDFSRAIELQPETALAYTNRGFVYRLLGQAQQAIDDLDQAIRFDPRIGLSYYNRALAYTLLGQDSQAIGDVNSAVALGIDRNTLESAIDALKGTSP